LGKISNAVAQLARVALNEPLAYLCAKYLSVYYRHLMKLQWSKESPEWFDHRIDLYRWRDHLNPHWVERGVYSKEVMFPHCKVLDVACGDGFYPLLFYVSTGASVDCIDISALAIKHAIRYHSHPQIRFFCCDALNEEFPQSVYDVITFDGAMDHFSQAQLDILFLKIKRALGGTGVFVGYQEIGFRAPDDEHPTSFSTTEELVSLLLKHFQYANTVVTDTPGRKNAYFRCSDNPQKIQRNPLLESRSEQRLL
jgi:SAM-dependent methyltransferase